MISPTFGLAQSNWRSMTLIAAINKKPITRTAMMSIVIYHQLSIIADNDLSNQSRLIHQTTEAACQIQISGSAATKIPLLSA